MKKISIGSLLIVGLLGTAAAEKKDRTEVSAPPADTGIFVPRPASVEVADLQELLELKNMYVRKYDLSGIRDTTLRVVFQVDEYFGRDSMRTLNRSVLGDVYARWDSSYLSGLKFQFVPKSDSTALLFCDLEDRGGRGTLLKFRRAAPDFKIYNSYEPKPFKSSGLKPGNMVPVMLFGSFWYDAELSKHFGGEPAYRFCMENEMEADMRNEAFDRMSHYWIVRIGLEKRER